MRFPHNTKVFRGQLDAAPFAGVFFLLLLFLLFNSSLVFTPGVPIQLPETPDLPGADRPTVIVAVDGAGQFYFENQIANGDQLKQKLIAAVSASREPLTLVIHAHREVKYDTIVQLSLLARNVGIRDALLATKPAALPASVPATPATP